MSAGMNETTAPVARPSRPLYWSIRREVWENRSLYLAPLAVAAVVLFSMFVSTVGLARRRAATLLLPLEQQRAVIEKPYDMAAVVILFTVFIVGIFYCLDALYGERRDRSILFWKSLPVSDLTAVVAKICIPLVVLPVFAFTLIVIAQVLMLVQSNAVLLAHHMPPTTYAQYPFIEQTVILLYGFVALALWHAPIYGWLLVVSGWAKRATFLWAFLPLAAIGVAERITIGTSYFGKWLQYRVAGHATVAFNMKPHAVVNSFSQLTPGRYLTTSGLWTGLIFAAICLGATVWLRRYREPI
jgi:ABC-2 type transport system permease protein